MKRLCASMLPLLLAAPACAPSVSDAGALASPDGGEGAAATDAGVQPPTDRDAGHGDDAGADLSDADGGADDGALAARYPGDVGIGADPAVLWHDDFEEATVAAVADRYDSARAAGLAFTSDVSAATSGAQALELTAGDDIGAATDLYVRLPGGGHERVYVRYYVRHEDAPYHHSGVWLGGYAPPTAWPQGGAGQRPAGDDRLTVGFEPIGTGADRRLDFYAYWMHMRSWMAEPSGSTAYYGNTLVHRADVLMRPSQWQCVEILVALNTDPGSAEGGELALWIDDQLIYHYTEAGPLGYWVRDKFCPASADAPSCLDYAPPPAEREQEVLNLQWRSSAELALNFLWLQNYTSQGQSTLWLDDVVVATERVGCVR